MNSFFKRFAKGFANNFKTIIQACVFSVIIWFFISIQVFPDITLRINDIPVEYQPTLFMKDENLQIISIDTPSVDIQVQGKRYSISQLTSENFTAVCDMSKIYEPGEHILPIDIETVTDGVDCSILTGSLTAKVKVVKIVSREFDVIPSTDSISLADGMKIEGEVTVSPEKITVTGEESAVDAIGHVEAQISDIDGALDHSDSFTASPIFFNRSGIKLASPEISTDTDSFTVSVPVYKLKTLPVQVKFTGVSGSSGFSPDELKYTLSPDEITIASPDSSVDRLDALDIGEISLTALTLKDLQGGVVLPVELPEDYKNISGNRTITVTFSDYEDFGQLGFTVPSENFTIINNPSSFDVKLLTNEILVSVVGYSDYIQSMTAADIYATINLLGTEIAEGTKTVSVTFRLKGTNVRAWVTGEEYKVDLLITKSVEDVELPEV